MIGVIVNVLAVALGGVLGTVFSKKLSTRFTTELNKVFGVCAIGMGISSVPLMQNMPAVILAVVAGTALGLACHLGEWISRGGELMEKPIGKLLGKRNGGRRGRPSARGIPLASGDGHRALLLERHGHLRLP